MLTYPEYELLALSIDEKIAGLQLLKEKPINDVIAMISFMAPNISEEKVEDIAMETIKDAENNILKLRIIKPKLLSLVGN